MGCTRADAGSFALVDSKASKAGKHCCFFPLAAANNCQNSGSSESSSPASHNFRKDGAIAGYTSVKDLGALAAVVAPAVICCALV